MHRGSVADSRQTWAAPWNWRGGDTAAGGGGAAQPPTLLTSLGWEDPCPRRWPAVPSPLGDSVGPGGSSGIEILGTSKARGSASSGAGPGGGGVGTPGGGAEVRC